MKNLNNLNVKGVANAFSLQMLKDLNGSRINTTIISKEQFEGIKNSIPSFVGHQDTANVLGVPMNRGNVTLEKGDSVLVAQITGGRLPEGSTTIPEGFEIIFVMITVE